MITYPRRDERNLDRDFERGSPDSGSEMKIIPASMSALPRADEELDGTSAFRGGASEIAESPMSRGRAEEATVLERALYIGQTSRSEEATLGLRIIAVWLYVYVLLSAHSQSRNEMDKHATRQPQ
jgi:hypothetical protein